MHASNELLDGLSRRAHLLNQDRSLPALTQ
jgi:hypothetical protein